MSQLVTTSSFLSCIGDVYTLRLATVLPLRLVKPYTLRLVKMTSKVYIRYAPDGEHQPQISHPHCT